MMFRSAPPFTTVVATAALLGALAALCVVVPAAATAAEPSSYVNGPAMCPCPVEETVRHEFATRSAHGVVAVSWDYNSATTAGSPLTTRVPVGSAVLWSIGDSLRHTIKSTSDEAFESGSLTNGNNNDVYEGGAYGAFSWKASKVGAVEYACGVHATMKGVLDVYDPADEAGEGGTGDGAGDGAGDGTGDGDGDGDGDGATGGATGEGTAAGTVFKITWSFGIASSKVKIQPGDAVEWVWGDDLSHTVETNAGQNVSFTSGLQRGKGFVFTQGPEVFSKLNGQTITYFCGVHPSSMTGQILVGDAATAVEPIGGDLVYEWQAIAHGTCMFLAFGFILPTGAFLAKQGKRTYHMITQPTGIAVALAGFVFAVLYADEFTGHFPSSHAYIGLTLVVLAVIAQPIFVFSKRFGGPNLKTFHHRNGQFLVFFGIANILMGMLRLEAPTIFQVLYGVWAGLMICVYLLYEPPATRGLRGLTGDRGAATASEASEALKRAQARSGAFEGPQTMEMVDVNLVRPEGGTDNDKASGMRQESVAEAQVTMSEEEARQFEHMRFYALAEASRDTIVGANDKGIILSWSGAGLEMFGYVAADMIGKSIQVIMPESFRGRHQRSLETEADSQQKKGAKAKPLKRYANIYQVKGLHADGSEFPVEVNVSSFMFEGKIKFYASIRDLSAHGNLAHEFDVKDPQYEAAVRRHQADLVLKEAFLTHWGIKGHEQEITPADLRRILAEEAGQQKLKLTDEQVDVAVQAIMAEGDEDGSGAVSFDELMAYFRRNGFEVQPDGRIRRAKEAIAASPDDEDNPVTLGAKVFRWWVLSGPQAIVVFLFLGVCATLFGTRYHQFNTPDANGWVPIARGAGQVLNFACSFILFTMCRNVLTFLRSVTWLRWFPFDSSIEFHKIIAWVILLMSLVHGLSHYANYNDVANNGGPSVAESAWDTHAGVTGNVLWIIELLMYVPALKWVRRGAGHNVFFYTHHLFSCFYVVILIHGLNRFTPNFWKWLLLPGVVYIAERMKRTMNKKEATAIVRVKSLPSKVTMLEFRRPETFKYVAGQYLFLNIPALARYEWHAFTISSAPEQETVSCHIRAMGDWTGDLFEMFKNGLPPSQTPDYPHPCALARLDGPYGAATEEVFGYKTAVLVAAGIGATPAASVLKHVLYRQNRATGCNTPNCSCKCSCCLYRLKNLYFVWTTRDVKTSEWFAEFLGDVRQSSEEENETTVDVRIFVTSIKLQQDDFNSTLLQAGLNSVMRQTGRDLLTDIQSITHFGRPNWERIFTELESKHTGDDIGVYFCGPPALGSTLRGLCAARSNPAKTKFTYQQEIF